MDNVSTLKFSLVKINSALICSIWVSIKSFTLQQTDLIAQSYTSVFHLDFWFPDSPKTCYKHCIILTSKLFFCRNNRTKSLHQVPKRTIPASGAALKKNTIIWAAPQTKMTQVDRKVELLDSPQNSNLLFSIK